MGDKPGHVFHGNQHKSGEVAGHLRELTHPHEVAPTINVEESTWLADANKSSAGGTETWDSQK